MNLARTFVRVSLIYNNAAPTGLILSSSPLSLTRPRRDLANSELVALRGRGDSAVSDQIPSTIIAPLRGFYNNAAPTELNKSLVICYYY